MSKGGIESVPANIPEMSPEQRQIYQRINNYMGQMEPIRGRLVGLANRNLDAASTLQSPQTYNQLYSNAMGQANGLQDQRAGIMRGELPRAFQENQDAMLRNSLGTSMGQLVNRYGNRGVLNSSVGGQAINGLSNAAATAALNGWRSNLGFLSDMTDRGYSDIQQPFAITNAAFDTAFRPVNSMMALANGTINQDSTMFQSLEGTRRAATSPQQSYYNQGTDFLGPIATIAGAAIGRPR